MPHNRCMDDHAEHDWVERAKKGDRAAIAELYKQYWRAARAAAYGVTGDLSLAEDAASAIVEGRRHMDGSLHSRDSRSVRWQPPDHCHPPFAIVRHPGYLGESLWALGSPLIVSLACGLILSAGAIAALVARTCLEDRTLRTELPGYAEYTRQV